MIVVLCDPHGHFEAATAAVLAHRTDEIKVIRVGPRHPAFDRLYIMDHQLAVELLADAAPRRPRVLAITDREDGHVLKEAVSVGAIGLLARSRLTETLATALTRIRRGQPYYDRRLLRATIQCRPLPDDLAADRRLTAREQEILAGIVAGHTTRGMAERFGISVATVRSHVHKVLAKLGVHSRIEAAGVVFAEGDRAPDIGHDAT